MLKVTIVCMYNRPNAMRKTLILMYHYRNLFESINIARQYSALILLYTKYGIYQL